MAVFEELAHDLRPGLAVAIMGKDAPKMRSLILLLMKVMPRDARQRQAR